MIAMDVVHDRGPGVTGPFELGDDEPSEVWSVPDVPVVVRPAGWHTDEIERGRQAKRESSSLASALSSIVRMTDPACDGTDSDIWFPRRAEGQANHGTEAKRICRGCVDLVPCLEGALEQREEFGIWGGAGEDERRILGRAFRRREADPVGWRAAVERHIQGLEDDEGAVEVVNRNGAGATHGIRVAYNRGCRCRACAWGMQDDVARMRRRDAIVVGVAA